MFVRCPTLPNALASSYQPIFLELLGHQSRGHGQLSLRAYCGRQGRASPTVPKREGKGGWRRLNAVVRCYAFSAVCKTFEVSQIILDLMFSWAYGLRMIFAKKWVQMAIRGYARVSTRDQDLTAQLDALKAAGAETVFREKVSGVRADRPQLAKLMASLKVGDIVVVTKLDRLGRSTRELLELIERIAKAGASFRSLGDPLWDTSSSQGRLLSTLLAAIADFERDLIRERTGEGRKRAMAAGTKFGRPRKLSDYQRQEAIKRRADGETLAAISKSYGVSIAMISRL